METSLPWSGSSIGDATTAPYSDDEFTDMMADLLTYDRTTQGVVNTAKTGYTGLLAVSCPTTVLARVANGIAFVDGKLYRNTANVDFTVAIPASGINYYTVVLDKDFAAQTVRLALLEAGGNSDGGASTASGVPSVTQTDGTTWEISIATLAVDSGGADSASITDTREMIDALTFTSTSALVADPFGGNARGTNAVDLQRDRSADTEVASGDYAVISGGEDNTASGNRSHAEGQSTEASGATSHAEGAACVASGAQSHAEGGSCVADGLRSHAEGSLTAASGDYSHAEGGTTTASGDYSHAEGGTTTASGNRSHAEGSGTEATGLQAHAEGSTTDATGTDSHAEGNSTLASGKSSHARGQETSAAGDYSTAAGFMASDGGFNGVFIWGDSEIAAFVADRVNQFKVRASGGTHLVQNSTSGALPVLTLEQQDTDEPFLKVIGDAAAANLTRNLVDEGDQASEVRHGWLKVEILDDGNQITDGDYFVPFYSLSA